MSNIENDGTFLLYNKYIHFPKISNSRSNRKLVNSSSTDFVNRNCNNFLVNKINRKRSLDNLIKPDVLNIMLFKLKNYYNYLNYYYTINNNIINYISFLLKRIKFKKKSKNNNKRKK